jgi:hypothetical protein
MAGVMANLRSSPKIFIQFLGLELGTVVRD